MNVGRGTKRKIRRIHVISDEEDSPGGTLGTPTRNLEAKDTSIGRDGNSSIVSKKVKGQSKMTLSTSPGCSEGDSVFCIKNLLPSMSLERVIKRARDWLEDLETLRRTSSNLQGAVSRRMRDRIAGIETAVDILASRAEDTGSASYLQPRNEELERINRELQETMRVSARIWSEDLRREELGN